MNALRTTDPAGMRTNWYDSVTSFLMALIVMLGGIVAALMFVWMMSEPTEPSRLVQPVRSGVKWSGLPIETDFVTPEKSEVTGLQVRPLDGDLQNLDLQIISTLAQRVAAHSELSRIEDTHALPVGSRAGHSGPLTDGDEFASDIVPRFERWQLQFQVESIDEYARMLDHHQIELAVIGGEIQGIDYVSSVSQRPTSRRVFETDHEKRLYFMWTRSSPLAEFDRRLIDLTKVRTEGREILKFISADLENELAMLEMRAAQVAGHDQVDAIAVTIFQSKRSGDQFPFTVIDQRFRHASHAHPVKTAF